NYLVYAYDRRTELSAEQAKLPKDQWTKEIQLKAAADKFNERLPVFGTSICARTERMRWAKDDVDVIRRILKGETIPKDDHDQGCRGRTAPNCARQPEARWDAYLNVPDPDALAADFAARGAT